MLTRVPLESSLLAWVGYDATRRQLQVQFRSGEHYLYFQVPPTRYHALLEAASKGAFFNHQIRNCFPYQHLSRPSSPLVLPNRTKTK
jgi:KTSC domain-containing protein